MASIYSKPINSFSLPPPYPRNLNYRSHTAGHTSLPARAPGSPLAHASTRMMCPQVGSWHDKHLWWKGHLGRMDRSRHPPPPLPACKAAIPPKTTHSFNEQRRIGSQTSTATNSQHAWVSSDVHIAAEVRAACLHVSPIPTPSTPTCS